MNQECRNATRPMFRFDIQLSNLAKDTTRENGNPLCEQKEANSMLIIDCDETKTAFPVSQHLLHGFETILWYRVVFAEFGE